MNHKESILILFDGPHLAYSPTAIQLYDALADEYDVTIIAQDPKNYNGQKVHGRKVLYHRYYGVRERHIYQILFEILKYFNGTIRSFKNNSLNYRDYFFKFLFIKKIVKQRKFKTILCFDNTNLFYCSLLKIKVDFVSLELCQNERLLKDIDKNLINCVIIQSEERYNYLFKDNKPKVFYVQNAPVYKEIGIKKSRKCLIYSGAANDVFGFHHCLNFLSKYKQEKLFVQGVLLPADKQKLSSEYPNLLNEKRLIISNEYLDSDDIIEYISNYEIGFCFYNFEHPYVKANYFNYVSAPSGKMFKYLAAGVPVVCSNISGFQFVKDFDCGILLNDLSADEIQRAVLEIRSNYDSYVANAVEAAKHYSFDKAIIPYLKFLNSES